MVILRKDLIIATISLVVLGYVCLLGLVVALKFICKKAGFAWHIRGAKTWHIIMIALASLVILPLFSLQILKHSSSKQISSLAEKLRTCTSAKIYFLPDGLHSLCLNVPIFDEEKLFNNEEKENLKQLKEIATDNIDAIRDLADSIVVASYERVMPTSFATNHWMVVILYENGGKVGSFHVGSVSILTTGRFGVYISSDEDLYYKLHKLSSCIRPFAIRAKCASNLKELNATIHSFSRTNNGKYPTANQWCDLLLQYVAENEQPYIKVSTFEKKFVCESAGKGQCHYAMNPNCEPNSSSDTVLLFEASPGWNKFGGPEIMTFDNHEPKGCNVVLNDGTIWFVRPEEVGQLKW